LHSRYLRDRYTSGSWEPRQHALWSWIRKPPGHHEGQEEREKDLGKRPEEGCIRAWRRSRRSGEKRTGSQLKATKASVPMSTAERCSSGGRESGTLVARTGSRYHAGRPNGRIIKNQQDRERSRLSALGRQLDSSAPTLLHAGASGGNG
jgi:hypothetical protein